MTIRRFEENPIIQPHMDGRMGENINGPSLIRVPAWVQRPLGRYYLYFGDHRGTYIRLAYADALAGPWRTYEPGALELEDAFMVHHLASPDVHVDEANRRIVMYYHGRDPGGTQLSRVATSEDGIHFVARPEVVAGAYLRAWRWDGWWYGMSMRGRLVRSRDGLTAFERGPQLEFENQRHLAVALSGSDLHVFYTRWYDAPERILHAVVRMEGTWDEWQVGPSDEVLRPERAYEGAGLPLEPSQPGPVHGRVNQLRDPAVFEEDGRTWLLYSVAGEAGIGLAEVEGLE